MCLFSAPYNFSVQRFQNVESNVSDRAVSWYWFWPYAQSQIPYRSTRNCVCVCVCVLSHGKSSICLRKCTHAIIQDLSFQKPAVPIRRLPSGPRVGLNGSGVGRDVLLTPGLRWKIPVYSTHIWATQPLAKIFSAGILLWRPGVRPISLLRLSLRFVDSTFPGDPPWT